MWAIWHVTVSYDSANATRITADEQLSIVVSLQQADTQTAANEAES